LADRICQNSRFGCFFCTRVPAREPGFIVGNSEYGISVRASATSECLLLPDPFSGSIVALVGMPATVITHRQDPALVRDPTIFLIELAQLTRYLQYCSARLGYSLLELLPAQPLLLPLSMFSRDSPSLSDG